MCLTLLAASSTRAQGSDSAQEGRGQFQFGPLGVTPTFAITNLGVDTNVLNTAENPERDTTGTFAPAVDLSLRAGRSHLSGTVGGQYLYFKKNRDMRSWGTADTVRWDVALGRLTPFLTAGYSNTTQRQGYEIDTYLHRIGRTVGGGGAVRLGARTTLTLTGLRSTLSYDNSASFLGVNVAPLLSDLSKTEQVEIRRVLTPLTTFLVSAQALQDRFRDEPVRDADSVRLTSGFVLDPYALISGSVEVGYRWFNPLHSELPSHRGLVAAVAAAYKLSAMEVRAGVDRDLAYSYNPTTPYYDLTNTNVTITERVTSRWDVVGRVGWQSLAYEQLVTVPGSAPVERGRTAGGGIGFFLNPSLRLGFDVNHYGRTSATALDRGYVGFRYGVSLSYRESQ